MMQLGVEQVREDSGVLSYYRRQAGGGFFGELRASAEVHAAGMLDMYGTVMLGTVSRISTLYQRTATFLTFARRMIRLAVEETPRTTAIAAVESHVDAVALLTARSQVPPDWRLSWCPRKPVYCRRNLLLGPPEH